MWKRLRHKNTDGIFARWQITNERSHINNIIVELDSDGDFNIIQEDLLILVMGENLRDLIEVLQEVEKLRGPLMKELLKPYKVPVKKRSKKVRG